MPDSQDPLIPLLRDLTAGMCNDLWVQDAAPRIRAVLRAESEREIAALRSDVGELKINVMTFAGPWAVEYAKAHGYPSGHLHSRHYDLLASCGARMDDFVRHEDGRFEAIPHPEPADG